MNWRKKNRWLHRKLGYLFFGMAVVYGISGIALNHHIARHWTPSRVEKNQTLEGVQPMSKQNVDKAYVSKILDLSDEKSNYKSFYFPTETTLMIYLKKGHILVDLESGTTRITTIRNRPFFREVNFLHYNKPKQLWTYFSDLFALSLVILAISGLFMARGKYGIKGKNVILLAIGVLTPLLFLLIYL